MIPELNDRSREIFRQIVDAYVATGEPVGSRTISRRLSQNLSAASVRNVMADLEEAGLLYAPHASAGRLPTDAGLRLYLDGLLELGNLSDDERADIDIRCATSGRSVEGVLNEAGELLSGLSHYAGVVLAPKRERPFKHVEFVPLSAERALAIMVTDDGMVENRLITLPAGLPQSALIEAGNYLTSRMVGRSLVEARELIEREVAENQAQLDSLAARVVEAGLATWSADRQDKDDSGVLIVRGQANLLEDVNSLADLELLRKLFQALETKQNMLSLLGRVQRSDGVQIFIGADNPLFGLSGSAMVVAPYGNLEENGSRVVGAIGVIGPTRMNYARIIPVVDYTAQVISRLLDPRTSETLA